MSVAGLTVKYHRKVKKGRSRCAKGEKRDEKVSWADARGIRKNRNAGKGENRAHVL